MRSTHETLSALKGYITKVVPVRTVVIGSSPPSTMSTPACLIELKGGETTKDGDIPFDDVLTVQLRVIVEKDPENIRALCDAKDALIGLLPDFEDHRGHKVYGSYDVEEKTSTWEFTLGMQLRR